MEQVVYKLVRDELRFRKKQAVLEYARECGNDTKAWGEFEVFRIRAKWTQMG